MEIKRKSEIGGRIVLNFEYIFHFCHWISTKLV